MWYELLDKDKSGLNSLHKRGLVDIQLSPVVTDFVSLVISILSIIIYQRTTGMEG